MMASEAMPMLAEDLEYHRLSSNTHPWAPDKRIPPRFGIPACCRCSWARQGFTHSAVQKERDGGCKRKQSYSNRH